MKNGGVVPLESLINPMKVEIENFIKGRREFNGRRFYEGMDRKSF